MYSTPSLRVLSINPPSQQLAVMINGLPGAMGKEVAAACLRRYVLAYL